MLQPIFLYNIWLEIYLCLFLFILGPQLPALPATQLPLTYERLNATAIRIRVRVPRVLDGRTGFFKVYHSSGLE